MDKKYLKIANTGLIEVEALTLMGASTKAGQNKIGQFGSGNKYALAYFLRNEYDLKIFVGNREVEVSTQRVQFREQFFNQIFIEGNPTSLTTEMGKDWKLWHALREIYCNAVDEGLILISQVEKIETSEDTTAFFIEMKPDLEQFMFNINDYIALSKEVLFENEHGKIYRKHGAKAGIYRKGILVHETEAGSIFDYDLPELHINESRIADYSWQIPEQMWKLLFSCPITSIAREILTNIKDKRFIENKIDDTFAFITNDMNPAWLEAIQEREIAPRSMAGYVKDEDVAKTLFLPDVLYNRIAAADTEAVSNSFKKALRGIYKEVEPTALQTAMLAEIMYFFEECKFGIPYPIKIVHLANKSIYGTITETEILISDIGFDKGKQFVINTIIEEYIHLKYGVADESRAFQDASIDLLITYMKNINAFNI